jgi:class 3 adenylate cyclase
LATAGHATSLAARLQSLAPGSGIVVSGTTYQLTEGYFVFKPPWVAQVKGVSELVPLYEVVAVVGEPGVGKSLLCYELKLRAP